MRVTMIGAGYVGLVSGACFADFGHHVTCIDKDAQKVAALNRGEIPIFEPGLADLVEANVREQRLRFAVDTGSVGAAEAVCIAVGTPSRRGDGHADLSFVYDAVREIAPLLSATAVVITKSTVPVGTGDEIERILRDARTDADIEVVSNPEFLREGAAIQDFKHPDRIVVGTDDLRARAVVAELYRPLYLNASPIFYVNRRTAELIKYAANAFRAMARKVVAALDGSVRGKTVAVLGLTFKPNTDDTRDSPAIPLITALQDQGATVRAYDPAGMEQARPQLSGVHYCNGAYAAAEGAHAIVIATEWEQFRALDLNRLKAVMAQPVIVDLRNIYRTDEMRRAKFKYVAVGRAGVD
jgi:UDP-glucose 6-dehydrogenase